MITDSCTWSLVTDQEIGSSGPLHPILCSFLYLLRRSKGSSLSEPAYSGPSLFLCWLQHSPFHTTQRAYKDATSSSMSQSPSPFTLSEDILLWKWVPKPCSFWTTWAHPEAKREDHCNPNLLTGGCLVQKHSQFPSVQTIKRFSQSRCSHLKPQFLPVTYPINFTWRTQ